jgi:hypothetical protein
VQATARGKDRLQVSQAGALKLKGLGLGSQKHYAIEANTLGLANAAVKDKLQVNELGAVLLASSGAAPHIRSWQSPPGCCSTLAKSLVTPPSLPSPTQLHCFHCSTPDAHLTFSHQSSVTVSRVPHV